MRLNQHDAEGPFIKAISTPRLVEINGRSTHFPINPNIDGAKILGFYPVTEPETPAYDPLTEKLEYSGYALQDGVSTRAVSVIPLDTTTIEANIDTARDQYIQSKYPGLSVLELQNISSSSSNGLKTLRKWISDIINYAHVKKTQGQAVDFNIFDRSDPNVNITDLFL